jgi:hypothetical protein
MVVSASTSFNPMLIYIVTSAYRKLGVLNENETPTAGMFQDASYAINSLIKEWQALGLHVWTEEEGILFLQPGRVKYTIGSDSIDNATDSDSWLLKALTANSLAATRLLTFETTADVVAGQNIGVTLNEGSIQWTTIDRVVSATVVRLAEALIGDVSSGNNVFVYTTRIARPLKMPSCRLYYYSSNPTNMREIPMVEFSRKEYMDLPTKTNLGTPTAFFYTPSLPTGTLYVWPSPQFPQYGVRFTWYRPLDDYLSNDNTSDLPSEWINCLTWNLAVELAPDFSVPTERFAILKSQAAEKLELVRGYDREAQPIYFGLGNPDMGRM